MISRFLLDDFSNKVVVVDKATTYAEGEYMAQRLHPEVILVDLGLPGRTGLPFVATIRRLVPEVGRGYRNPENLRPISADPTNPSFGKAQARSISKCGTYVVESVPRSDGFWRFKEEGVESAIVVPVRAGEKMIGTIQLGTHMPRKLKPEDIHLFTAIRNQLGIAVQKSKLYETTLQNLARMRALHEMNKAITSTMDLRATLEILLEKIKGLLPYSAATIRLFNNKNGLLEPVVCRNLDKKEWKVERRKGGRSLATLVLETKAPIIVKYAQADPRDRDPEFCQKHNVISYLGVPLIVKEEVLGMLNLYSREELFYDYRFQKPLVC